MADVGGQGNEADVGGKVIVDERLQRLMSYGR